MGGVAEQLALDLGYPRRIPLASATWGMYGTAQGWAADGRPATRRGYIIKPPRIYTGGIGEQRDRADEPLLSFVVLDPPGPGALGSHIGMYATPDATFAEELPPPDRPLTYPRLLARRMPAVDLRRRDSFYLWEQPGKPRHHLQADPEPAEPGRCALAVVVDGLALVRTLPVDLWVDVVDPAREPWQAVPS